MVHFSVKRSVGLAVAGLAVAMFAATAMAGESDSQLIADAHRAVAAIEKTDPGMRTFLDRAAGYVVFPGVGKAGLGIGGAHGDGVLFERGKPVGKASMTQVTVGAQAGAQKYAEVIVFETEKDLAKLKEGKLEFSGNVSAVAIKSGVSKASHFENGVAVFTHAEGGLMYEASMGGQKFSYHPLTVK
jgi:lipid-binding SYLF domain-containing protein